jgi:hypothetical protein
LDLRWAVGLNLSIAVVGVDRMKALKNEFEKIKPKRMVCQTLEKTDRFMPFEAIECTDTDGVAQWQR